MNRFTIYNPKHSVLRAFTLVELLVVITVLSFLAVFAFPNILDFQSGFKEQATIHSIGTFKVAIRHQALNSRIRCAQGDTFYKLIAGDTSFTNSHLSDMVEAMTENDITRMSHAPLCTTMDLPLLSERKFFDEGVPANPFTGKRTLNVCENYSCDDSDYTVTRLTPNEGGGWCVDSQLRVWPDSDKSNECNMITNLR